MVRKRFGGSDAVGSGCASVAASALAARDRPASGQEGKEAERGCVSSALGHLTPAEFEQQLITSHTLSLVT